MVSQWRTFDDDVDFGEQRAVSATAFQFITITDMEYHCGSDPKYVCEVDIVDLALIPEKEQLSAKECYGCEDEDIDVEYLAQVCHGYGLKAPVWSESSNNRSALHRAARSQCRELLDESKLEIAMDRPVNALGSTAHEFMLGDFTSAMQRGCESGEPGARLTARLYGVPQAAIDNIRPGDFLPYVVGYNDALAGADHYEPRDELSPEYTRGYERGQRVKAGEAPAPSWLTSPNQ